MVPSEALNERRSPFGASGAICCEGSGRSHDRLRDVGRQLGDLCGAGGVGAIGRAAEEVQHRNAGRVERRLIATEMRRGVDDLFLFWPTGYDNMPPKTRDKFLGLDPRN